MNRLYEIALYEKENNRQKEHCKMTKLPKCDKYHSRNVKVTAPLVKPWTTIIVMSEIERERKK